MNRRPGQVDHTCHTLAAHEIASLETCSMMNSTETLHELQYLFALQRSNIQSLGVDPLSATVNQKYVAIRPILLKAIVAVATHHQMSDDVVYLAASILDAFVAKNTRGLGWHMHCGAEVTESSTNKQHHPPYLKNV